MLDNGGNLGPPAPTLAYSMEPGAMARGSSGSTNWC